MLQLPAELLSLSGEPVLLIRGGKVLFANDAACGLLGRGCTEKSPQELFGGEIAGMQAPSFVGETEVEGRRVLLRVSAFSGVRAVFLTACGGVGPQLGSACLYALRSELMSLSASAAMLKSRLPAEDEVARSAFCCASQSFYRVNRMLRNLSVIRDAENDSLIFQPQPLELCGLLREIAENVRQSGDTPDLRLDLPERLVITGDAQLLELMIFNLLPVPPLDGFGIVTNLFHLEKYSWYEKYYQYGYFILIFLVLLGVVGAVLTPLVGWVMYPMHLLMSI